MAHLCISHVGTHLFTDSRRYPKIFQAAILKSSTPRVQAVTGNAADTSWELQLLSPAPAANINLLRYFWRCSGNWEHYLKP